MKLKLDAAGNVVTVKDGEKVSIVYVNDDGKDLVFDVPSMYAKITDLTRENAATRKRADDTEAAIAKFAGIENPEEALKALGIVKNLDAKKLVDAGEIEKVKGEVARAYELKLSESDKRNKELEGTLFNEMVGGAFSRSKFIAEKVAVPADLIQARFGQLFGVEKGVVFAKDARGEKLYSPNRPGELANVDEALEIMITSHPNRDQLLKASGGKGGGAQGGGGGPGAGGGKQITRTQYDAMSPMEKAAVGRDATTKIVDT